MTGEEVYKAGDALAPTPAVDDARAIDLWLPRAETWVAMARAWRVLKTSEDDSWAFYVDARLQAVGATADALREGKDADAIEQTDPPASGIVYDVGKAVRTAVRPIGAAAENVIEGVGGTGKSLPILAFAVIFVTGIAAAVAMSR